MSRPRVLFAHERRTISRAVELALDVHGFDMFTVEDGTRAAGLLREGFDALVVDVGIPGTPSFELVEVARANGARAVILVASVYSRTSYKRSPQRLYGADEYVEIHHLGDQLPRKLRHTLGLEAVEHERASTIVSQRLREEGDRRLEETGHPHRLATLIAADVILYNGDAVARALTVEEAHDQLRVDLEGGRAVFDEAWDGEVEPGVDYVGDALDDLLQGLVGEGGTTA